MNNTSRPRLKWTTPLVVPETILLADLTPTALRLWCALSKFANVEHQCWPSNGTLAAMILGHPDARHLWRAKRDLVEAGLLKVTSRHDKDGRQTSSLYTLYAPCLEMAGRVAEIGKGEVASTGEGEVAETGKDGVADLGNPGTVVRRTLPEGTLQERTSLREGTPPRLPHEGTDVPLRLTDRTLHAKVSVPASGANGGNPVTRLVGEYRRLPGVRPDPRDGDLIAGFCKRYGEALMMAMLERHGPHIAAMDNPLLAWGAKCRDAKMPMRARVTDPRATLALIDELERGRT